MVYRILFISILLTAFAESFSQDTYLDEITADVCNCIGSKIENPNQNFNLEMELGFCIIEASISFESEIRNEFGINIYDMNEQTGEEFGKIIGVKMVISCPETAMKFYNYLNDSGELKEHKNKYFIGKVTDIDKNKFIEFTVTNDEGKKMRFLWMEFFESDINIEKGHDILFNKIVQIGYKEKEFFDPRINEYKIFNIITSLSKE